MTADDAQLAQRIAAYLGNSTGEAVQVQGLKRFPVGFSWRTYGLRASRVARANDEQELILRLGSDAGLYAPYSSVPQVLALRSLHGSEVPVPAVYGSSDDASLLGAPFLFCEKVAGSAPVPWVAAGSPPMDEGLRQTLAAQFTDALAALHRQPWPQQPIAALAQGITAADAAQRNVQLWEDAMRRWATRPYPLAEWGLGWLKRHAPPAPRVTIVHGDWRTGNFLEQDGRITAILDWELVHLGDPHEDLGWLSLPMYKGGSPYLCRLLEPEPFFARYAAASGIDVDMASLHYHQVFSLFKLAATHMAAARCFEDARSNDLRMPAMGSQIATCLRQMERLIQRGKALT